MNSSNFLFAFNLFVIFFSVAVCILTFVANVKNVNHCLCIALLSSLVTILYFISLTLNIFSAELDELLGFIFFDVVSFYMWAVIAIVYIYILLV